ncbi:MAG: hypothetical protein ABI910_10500 [Gemmatimonadota bacterium]
MSGLVVAREQSAASMAALQGRTADEMCARLEQGHRAYVARLGGVAAAWGWVATTSARIGELETTFAIGRGARYLWNFVTVTAHRGMGIYPRLLNGIVEAELAGADRSWIAYAPENHASSSGIHEAGFTTIAQLSFDRSGRPALRAADGFARVAASASVLTGIPTIEQALAHCWRCVRMGRTAERSCRPGQCACDYQRPERGCDTPTTTSTATRAIA